MSKEIDVDSSFVGATVKTEIVKKVLKKYKHSEKESNAIAIARALEDSVRDVVLTIDEMQEVVDERKRKLDQRMKARAKKAGR